MYYIFFINNVEFGEKIWSATDIMSYLLNNHIWAFSFSAPNLKRMDEGDKVVVYLAGRDNRFFTADFTIASKPYEANSLPDDPEWLSMFPIRINIQDIKLWTKKLPIGDVIGQLDFIKDKKNYGLYFRQSTRIIDDEDFAKIVH